MFAQVISNIFKHIKKFNLRVVGLKEKSCWSHLNLKGSVKAALERESLEKWKRLKRNLGSTSQWKTRQDFSKL